MVEQSLGVQDKRMYDVPFTMTDIQVLESPIETISLTASLVVSVGIVSKSSPNEKE